MKKIKFLLFLASFGLMVSCNDALDIVQEGEINDETSFRTVQDLKGFLIADIYPRVSISNEIAFTAVFTDEVGIAPDSGGQGEELHRYNFFATDGYASSMWISNKTIINRVNRLIALSAQIQTSTPTEELQKQSIIAEARALRAFAYLQLQSYFTTDMADPNALGAILFDFVPATNATLPRATNAQIYDLMEQDLAFAAANLGTNVTVNPTFNDYKYVTPAMIEAIKARMYVYRKDYVNAETAANNAISLSGLSLSNAATYNLMWNDLQRGEIIFAASRPSSGGWGNVAANFYFNTTDINGGAFHNMGMNLYNLYNSFPTDVRRTAFVDITSDLANNNIMINKYPGKASAPLRNDLKIFRVSEMKLILAECQVGKASPNLPAAAALVQEIRTARGTGQALPTYATAQEAWRDILVERRKELSFEGHRYVDLRRLGPIANVSIDRNVADDNIPSTPLTLPITDHRFTFPIPQDEVRANPNIIQNPNYN